MNASSIEGLKEDIKAAFGRELTAAEIERYADRLPIMLRNLRLVAKWSPKLGPSGPSQVQRIAPDAKARARCTAVDPLGR